VGNLGMGGRILRLILKQQDIRITTNQGYFEHGINLRILKAGKEYFAT
jgi:hypothetical protein